MMMMLVVLVMMMIVLVILFTIEIIVVGSNLIDLSIPRGQMDREKEMKDSRVFVCV